MLSARLLKPWPLVLCLAGMACSGPAPQPEAHSSELVGSADSARLARAPEPHGAVGPKRSGKLWYLLHQGDAKTLVVRMRLMQPDRRTSLFLPGSWAGVHTHADAISIRRAVGPKGPRPWKLLRAQGRVDIDTEGLPWVDFEYEIKLAPTHTSASRFSAQHLDGGFFAYAPTLFVLPSARWSARLIDIPVEIHVPKAHTLMSTWPLKRRALSRANQQMATYGYVIKDIESLRDAFVATTGSLKTLRGPGVEVAFSPEFEGSREAIAQVIHRVLAGYARAYGDLGDVSVLVRALPKKGDALWGTGRRGGFVLELPNGATVDDDLEVLVAHEALHLWNGHTLIPAPKQERRTRWFKEGVTHYIALRSAHKRGLIDRARVLTEWAQAAQRYALYHAKPQMRQALSHRYHYDRGVLLAVAMEATLGDPHLMDRWMVALLRASQRSPRPYTQAHLLEALLSASAQDAALTPLWSAHVQQDKLLDIKGMFASIGLHWLPRAGQRAARLMPLNQPDSKQMYLNMTGHQEEPSHEHPPSAD